MFDHGAYDLRGCPPSVGGAWTTVPTREAGALFWIPSVDEWIKAAYYDPNRYGAGQHGYWTYPNRLEGPGVADYPASGGQTDAGICNINGLNPVAAYTGSMSAWGLFDTSGGVKEFADTAGSFRDDVFVMGTAAFQALPQFYDRVDWLTGQGGSFGGVGFRIAAAVPGPGGACVFGVVGVVCVARRRRVERGSGCERVGRVPRPGR